MKEERKREKKEKKDRQVGREVVTMKDISENWKIRMKHRKKGNQLRQLMNFKLVDLVKDDTHKSNQCDDNNGAALLPSSLPPMSWIKSML